MDHLRNFFAGFTLAANWGPQERTRYRRPQGGFLRDQKKLRGDVQRVGEDLKKAYVRHGKSVTES